MTCSGEAAAVAVLLDGSKSLAAPPLVRRSSALGTSLAVPLTAAAGEEEEEEDAMELSTAACRAARLLPPLLLLLACSGTIT
jgi:hypothetical protein